MNFGCHPWTEHGNELMIYDGLENVMDGKGGVGGRYPLYKSNFVLNKSNTIPKTLSTFNALIFIEPSPPLL
jgi:hypothetical protein